MFCQYALLRRPTLGRVIVFVFGDGLRSGNTPASARLETEESDMLNAEGSVLLARLGYGGW